MKTALVTGSSGGIGAAITNELLRNGWRVIGVDVLEGLTGLNEAGTYIHFKADVTRPDQLEQVEMGIHEYAPRLDALVYCAGIFDHFPLAEGDSKRFARIVDVNVTGAANAVKAFSPLLESGVSRIVMISSETAKASLPFQVYGLSKKMLEAYADVLRQESAMLKIPVILVRPGAHETGLLKQSHKALGEFHPDSRFASSLDTVKRQGQRIIDKGSANPTDIAKAVFKGLTVKRPARVYHVNVSARFYMLAMLPRGLKEWLVRTFLR